MTEQEGTDRKKRIVTKLKYPLPDVRISFEKHFEIIKAYAAASDEGRRPVSYRDFEKLVSNPQTVSGSNEFFESLGLIKEVEKQRGKYLPTEICLELSSALKWKKQEGAKKILKKILLPSWFWSSAKELLEVKESITRNELKEKLGYDSGADPERHLPALHVLIDYLTHVGLIREQDGKLAFGEVETAPVQRKEEKGEERAELPERRVATPMSATPSIILGVLISPEMSEEQIRNTIRIISDELKKLMKESD